MFEIHYSVYGMSSVSISQHTTSQYTVSCGILSLLMIIWCIMIHECILNELSYYLSHNIKSVKISDVAFIIFFSMCNGGIYRVDSPYLCLIHLPRAWLRARKA